MSDNKSTAGKVDAFLRHPVVQGISAAFVCGLTGFALTLMFSNLLWPDVAIDAIIALIAGGLFAFLGARSTLSPKREERPSRSSVLWMGSFAGATMIFGAAFTILGLTGNWLLLCALGAGMLIASLLAILR